MHDPFTGKYRVTLDWEQHIEEEGKGAVDWGMGIGTPLPACSPGRVTYSFYSDAGYTATITRDDGSWTRYGHGSPHGFPSPHTIEEFDNVRMVSGNSGFSTGPHLHAYDVDAEGHRCPPFTTGAKLSTQSLNARPSQQQEDDTDMLWLLMINDGHGRYGKPGTIYRGLFGPGYFVPITTQETFNALSVRFANASAANGVYDEWEAALNAAGDRGASWLRTHPSA